MTNYLFVGERRSSRAVQIGVFWEDGKLAAKTLFDALRFCGLDPQQQVFINLFRNNGKVNRLALTDLQMLQEGLTIVGMGRKVQTVLEESKIRHLKLIHPAARGKIRKTELYQQHVKEVLCPK